MIRFFFFLLPWASSVCLGALLPFDQVKSAYKKSDARLLDRKGVVIHEQRVSQRGRTLEWIALASISPALQSAVLLAEDKRFFDHAGVDWLAVASATWAKMSGSSVNRGASTLSMQVASFLRPSLRSHAGKKSLWQKWLQMQSAWDLEKHWTKAQIFEAYLNLVTFRGELHGVMAASRGLFRKDPHGLNESEAIILASLIRSPNAPWEKVAARACALGQKLNRPVPCELAQALTRTTLSSPYFVKPTVAGAPHVAQILLGQCPSPTPCEQVESTLDGELQRFVQQRLKQALLPLKTQNVQDGAVVVLDNKTGDVLAYVGNPGASSSAIFVDGVKARRQAGSILKPFLYALAFDRRLLTAASILEDSPLDIPVSGGVYRPQNYDSQFHGKVSARMALASSLNVPAVKTLLVVKVENFLKTLHDLGFGALREAEIYGPSLALGSADITLWEVTNAYRTLANGGEFLAARLAPHEKPARGERVFSKEAAYLVSDILSDRESRSLTFGLENPLSTRFWTAVKTGTSKDMRDNWCVGFSDRYTVGVWVGNFSGAPMWSMSGVTGAAPIWIEVMNYLHRDHGSVRPKIPKSMVRKEIEWEPTHSLRSELFMRGTENAVIGSAQSRYQTRIVYPVAGTIVALDPDIPRERQRLFFDLDPHQPELAWVLDGIRLGTGEGAVSWIPVSGKHELSLENPSGEETDSVHFEVRGF